MIKALRLISRILAEILTLAFIKVITAFHHMDGLMGSVDRLMCYSTPEDKIKCMHGKPIEVNFITLR